MLRVLGVVGVLGVLGVVVMCCLQVVLRRRRLRRRRRGRARLWRRRGVVFALVFASLHVAQNKGDALARLWWRRGSRVRMVVWNHSKKQRTREAHRVQIG